MMPRTKRKHAPPTPHHTAAVRKQSTIIETEPPPENISDWDISDVIPPGGNPLELSESSTTNTSSTSGDSSSSDGEGENEQDKEMEKEAAEVSAAKQSVIDLPKPGESSRNLRNAFYENLDNEHPDAPADVSQDKDQEQSKEEPAELNDKKSHHQTTSKRPRLARAKTVENLSVPTKDQVSVNREESVEKVKAKSTKQQAAAKSTKSRVTTRKAAQSNKPPSDPESHAEEEEDDEVEEEEKEKEEHVEEAAAPKNVKTKAITKKGKKAKKTSRRKKTVEQPAEVDPDENHPEEKEREESSIAETAETETIASKVTTRAGRAHSKTKQQTTEPKKNAVHPAALSNENISENEDEQEVEPITDTFKSIRKPESSTKHKEKEDDFENEEVDEEEEEEEEEEGEEEPEIPPVKQASDVRKLRIKLTENSSKNKSAVTSAAKRGRAVKQPANQKLKLTGKPKAGHAMSESKKNLTTKDMIVSALSSLKERKGSTIPAIKKYISINCEASERNLQMITKILRDVDNDEWLVRTAGTGASSGSRFKLPTKYSRQKNALQSEEEPEAGTSKNNEKEKAASKRKATVEKSSNKQKVQTKVRKTAA